MSHFGGSGAIRSYLETKKKNDANRLLSRCSLNIQKEAVILFVDRFEEQKIIRLFIDSVRAYL